jgi:hypothetical protein
MFADETGDGCDLLLQQELKFRRTLLEGLDFRFHFLQDEDKERQELHHWLELEKSLPWGFSFLALGEPTFRKEDSDIGFGLGYTLAKNLKLGLRHLFVDFNFNDRNSTSQRYARKPFTDQFSAEYERGGQAWAASLEIDSPLIRELPAESRVFSYRRTRFNLTWRQEVLQGLSRRAEYAYEFQRKGDLFSPDPTVASIESLRKVHRFLGASAWTLSSQDRIEAGSVFFLRAARSDKAHAPAAGIFYQRWELEPYARWRRTLSAWLVSELGGFLSLGENLRRFPGGAAPSSYEGVVQAKIAGGLDFLFGPSGRIGVYGAFDLDGPGHLWDGGNIRAMFLF